MNNRSSHQATSTNLLIRIGLYCFAMLMLVSFNGCENPGSYDNWEFSDYILVAGDSSLQRFDLQTEEWISPVGIGPGANWMHKSSNGLLYVVNSTSHSLQAFSFNRGSFELSETVDLGLQRNTSPYAAVTAKHWIAVTNLLTNSISLIDEYTHAIVDEFPVGRAPEGILASNDTLFVINSGYNFDDFTFHTGSIYQIVASTGEILDSLQLGMNPQFGMMDHHGRLHIVCTGDYRATTGEVWVLDRSSLDVIGQISTGHSPGRIVLGWANQTRVAYLAAGGWSNDGESEGLILSYDVETYELHTPISANLGVVDVCFDDARLYAVCRDAMTLDVFTDDERIASYDIADPPNAVIAYHGVH